MCVGPLFVLILVKINLVIGDDEKYRLNPSHQSNSRTGGDLQARVGEKQLRCLLERETICRVH
jgi:hypothetical protein